MTPFITNHILFTLILCMVFAPLMAQDNYEIQVYGVETVPKGFTMVELHSNYTLRGRPIGYESYASADKALHETIEVTYGLASIMELGVYVFTTELPSNYAPKYVGDHLRWRIRNAEKWKWPVGASLSVEAGYQKRAYAEDDWVTEIRPIIDKDYKKWYFCLNPVFDYAFRGLNKNVGLQFSPQIKISYKIKGKYQPGIEYYGGMGALNNIEPLNRQQNQLGFVVDLDLSPKWEFNAGYLVGLTPSVEKGIIKVIIGRKLGKAK